MKPTIGSLFAGIGGFDLGFERAGFKTLWQCEIDKQAQGVLRRHFPDAALHSDVREVGAHNLKPVDVLTFGSPCQDLSVAGKRAGLAGERSGLFHAAARVIRELRERYGKPDFAIWENVPGAFSSNDGRDFAAVVQAMADLGARDVCWRVLDSRYFGVAQRRRRVFLVADFRGERAEQVLFESESLRGNPAPRRKARKEAPRSVGAGVEGGGDEDLSATVSSKWAKGTGGYAGVSEHHNLTVYEAPAIGVFRQSNVAGTLTAQSGGLGETRNPAFVVHPLAVAFHPTQDPISLQDGTTHAMTNGSSRGQVCATGEVTHALTCTASRGAAEDGTGRGCPIVAQTAMQVRRLTPVECEALQGFPRNWTAEARLPDGTVKHQADGPRYKQLGNAVTVNVAEWIARRLWAAMEDA